MKTELTDKEFIDFLKDKIMGDYDFPDIAFELYIRPRFQETIDTVRKSCGIAYNTNKYLFKKNVTAPELNDVLNVILTAPIQEIEK